MKSIIGFVGLYGKVLVFDFEVLRFWVDVIFFEGVVLRESSREGVWFFFFYD